LGQDRLSGRRRNAADQLREGCAPDEIEVVRTGVIRWSKKHGGGRKGIPIPVEASQRLPVQRFT
jgi:hypothetical protein